MRVRQWLREAWELIGADLPLFSVAAFLAISVSLFSLGVLAFPLAAGLCLMLLQKLHGRTPELSHLWEGITQHFPAAFTVYLVAMGLALPFDLANLYLRSRPAPWPLVGMGLVLVALCVVNTPLLFCLQLIADRDVSAREALRLSWSRVWAAPATALATVVVCSLLLLAGLFACGFGLILTLPVSLAVAVLAYRDLVGNFGAPQMTSLTQDSPEEVDDDEDHARGGAEPAAPGAGGDGLAGR
jgi:hypothetical protein